MTAATLHEDEKLPGRRGIFHLHFNIVTIVDV